MTFTQNISLTAHRVTDQTQRLPICLPLSENEEEEEDKDEEEEEDKDYEEEDKKVMKKTRRRRRRSQFPKFSSADTNLTCCSSDAVGVGFSFRMCRQLCPVLHVVTSECVLRSPCVLIYLSVLTF